MSGKYDDKTLPVASRAHRAARRSRIKAPNTYGLSMRILVLLTDAFDQVGGIAEYNRALLSALSANRRVTEVTALVRHGAVQPPILPKLRYRSGATSSVAGFLNVVAGELFSPSSYQLVLCGHLHLLPCAELLRLRFGAPLLQIMHGIEVWQPTGRWLVDMPARHLKHAAPVSRYTWNRFSEWSGCSERSTTVSYLPGPVNLRRFAPGPKNAALAARYGLTGKTVLLTVARLHADERSKGIDEVLEALPALCAKDPEIRYLIVGEGSDRPRLTERAAALRVAEQVVFAGYVPDSELPEHYRLADAYVMPSSKEGLGLVFLEALACGIPALGSVLDGSREALLEGRLGVLVDPRRPAELVDGIREVLQRPRGTVPAELSEFGDEAFAGRLDAVLQRFVESSHRYDDAATGS